MSAKKQTTSRPPAEKSTDKTVAAGPDFYTSKIKGREIYLLLAAIALGCGIVFSDFITGKKVYLFKDIGSDSLNIFFPWLAHLSGYMKSSGVPSWTFSQGMGQNVFPLWLGDFFSNILMLFGQSKLPYGLAVMEIVKIFLCGFVFFKYLKQLKVNEFSAYIGAFLFSFCGYIVIGGCWTIFSVEALYAALILYGTERWLNHGKWPWLVVGVACMSFLQPFFLFMYTLVLAVYIPIRYNDLHPGDWKKFPSFVLRTSAFAALGVAISAYQLLPDILQYLESPRVGGEASFISKLKSQPMFDVADALLRFTTTFRAFGSDMLGTGTNFKGWQNYLEAPVFYCGILCLVVFPQAFSSFSKKQKIAYGILVFIFVIPILFPFFRYTFWAYTGDYFRTFSLIITVFLIFFSVRAISHIIKTGTLNKVVLGVTVILLLIFLYTPAAQYKTFINQGLRTFATLLIFVYALLLFGLTAKDEKKGLSKLLLILVCFIELVYFANITINSREVMLARQLNEKTGYNDYTVDAVNYLTAHDKNFYRINKDYSSGLAMHASINDAKVQGFYGTSSYFSFNQKNYIKFLGDLNVIDPKDENSTRWAKGLIDRPLLFSLASGKYWLSKRPENYLQNFGYDSIAKFGDVRVFKNRYAIPLGVAYSKVLDETTFKTLSPTQKDLYLLRGCVVADTDKDLMAVGKKFNLSDTAASFAFDQYGLYVKALRQDSLTITQFRESDIKGNITVKEPKILFFSIPYDEGWKATVNGTDTKLYRINAGLTGLKIPAGRSSVELVFEPRLMKKGAMISLIALLAFISLMFIDYRRRRKVAQE